MPNISVESSIIVFRPQGTETIEEPCDVSRDVLRAREMEERAAAKSSRTISGRRVHHELAKLYLERGRAKRAKG